MSEMHALAARLEYSLDHPYAWVITRDRDHELGGNGRSSVGVAGPSTAPQGTPEDWAKTFKEFGVAPIRFRLMDEGDIDDCNEDESGAVSEGHELYGVVCEGLLYDPEGKWPFGPLDDYGRANYGCVGIKHFNPDTERWDWV